MSVDPNHASAAEKEPSDRKQTTDDTSVSVSNHTDQKPEEAHGSDRDRTTEACAAVNTTHSTPTDGQIERRDTFLPRHNSEKEMEDCWKIHKKETDKEDESEKEDTEYQYVEATPGKTYFDDLPDEVILQIFKCIGVRDRLRLEGVNKRWQRLLIQSWKDVRVLTVRDIYCPPLTCSTDVYSSSLTDDNIRFLGDRVAPFVKCLDFTCIREEKEESAIGRQIFLAVSEKKSPPCALEEVQFDELILDESILSSLKGIGNQITSIGISYRECNPYDNPEKMIKDMEDGRSFFKYFPHLVKLECDFPGIIHNNYHSNIRRWNSLPTSVEYLTLHFSSDARLEKQLLRLRLVEPRCSLRELHLIDFQMDFHIEDENILSKFVTQYPNLEVLEIWSFCDDLFGLEVLAPLTKLRKLDLTARTVDTGFLSRALSFAFREELEILHMAISDGEWSYDEDDEDPFPQEHLENLSHFPNLKDIHIGGSVQVNMNLAGIEKIALGCKKLQRISLESCEALSSEEGREILRANCPDLQFQFEPLIRISLVSSLSEEPENLSEETKEKGGEVTEKQVEEVTEEKVEEVTEEKEEEVTEEKVEEVTEEKGEEVTGEGK